MVIQIFEPIVRALLDLQSTDILDGQGIRDNQEDLARTDGETRTDISDWEFSSHIVVSGPSLLGLLIR